MYVKVNKENMELFLSQFSKPDPNPSKVSFNGRPRNVPTVTTDNRNKNQGNEEGTKRTMFILIISPCPFLYSSTWQSTHQLQFKHHNGQMMDGNLSN